MKNFIIKFFEPLHKALLQWMAHIGFILYANTAGITNNFKWEVLTGIHALGTGTGVPARTVSVADVVKCALFLAAGSLSPSATAAYAVTSEVANSGSYAAGGAVVTQANPALFTNTGTWNPSASLSWTTFTATAFDTALFYNSSQGNKAIELANFGSQTISAGTFTLTMPANGAATSMIQLT